MFGLKLFLKTVFQNIYDIIFVLSENCYYYLNQVFYLFFVKKQKEGSNVFFMFSLFFLFLLQLNILITI